MSQEIAPNWIVIGLTLAALFCFGICYALLVNWMSRKKVTGQTAYAVVAGVTVALVASIPTFGLFPIAILFSYFGACGLPMVVEYAVRIHKERRADQEKAEALAKEALHDGQS